MADLSLRQGAKQSLKQNQRLMMSPEMQQAIQTLQMPLPELATLMRSEIALNPIFEEVEWLHDGIELSISEPPLEGETPTGELSFDEDDFSMMTRLSEEFEDLWKEGGNFSMQRTREEDEKRSYHESSIASRPTLYESLLTLAKELLESEEEIESASQILGNLDDSGLLTTSIEELSLLSGVRSELLESVLWKIQRFKPAGLGAKTLQESLLIQLEVGGHRGDLAYRIVEEHFNDLIHNRLRPIERAMNVDAGRIEQVIQQEIAPLNLHPSSGFTKEDASYLVADLSIEEDEFGQLIPRVNNESLPQTRFSQKYLRMLRDPKSSEELRRYIEERLSSGQWLLRTVNQRGDTLLRIANFLIEHQKEYISDPLGSLKPMTMKEMADAIEVHESTIARAVSHKNLYCPRGLIPLRSLFTNGYSRGGEEISAETVRDQIAEIVSEEDKSHPLSDEAISKELKRRGIECARRTVAKHRRSLSLGTAAQRRSYLAQT